MTEWRTKFQRSMNLADNATKAQCTDSLLNYETVKYYGNEMYEVNNYKKTVLHYQVGQLTTCEFFGWNPANI